MIERAERCITALVFFIFLTVAPSFAHAQFPPAKATPPPAASATSLRTQRSICSLPSAIDGSTCQGSDPCLKYQCKAKQCVSVGAAPNGTVCNDNNKCTQTDSCQAGKCTGGNKVVCKTSDQCHNIGACNPATGACSNPLKPNGALCNDSNACTSGDSCQVGACKSTGAVNCDDSNPCTVDSCSTLSGCAHQSVADGTKVAAGTCIGGKIQTTACPPGKTQICTVTNPCQTGQQTCDASGNWGACIGIASNAGKSCDDGNACTQTDVCQAGQCVGSNPLSCNDNNICTQDTCSKSLGCQNAKIGVGTLNACGSCDAFLTPTIKKGDPCSAGSGQCTVFSTYQCAPAKNQFTCAAIAAKSDGYPIADDSNPCTVDICKGGQETHQPITGGICQMNGKPGICASGLCNTATCGNGMLDADEQCDMIAPQWPVKDATCQDFGAYGGTLLCGKDCKFNTISCYGSGKDAYTPFNPPSFVPDVCGNWVVDAGEACDHQNFGKNSCASLGYYGGTLACATDCKSFSKAGCYGSPGNQYSGIPQDPDYVPSCGNKTVDPSETCEATTNSNLLWPPKSCADFGFFGGQMKCTDCAFDTTQCYGAVGNKYGGTQHCGDGATNVGEKCDTNDTCVSKGFYGGKLGCKNCQEIDTSGCYTKENDPYAQPMYTCGNKKVDAKEQCDKSAASYYGGFDGDKKILNGANCHDFGFYSGSLSCGSDCKFNFAWCYGGGDAYSPAPTVTFQPGICGNWVMDAGESCDHGNFGGNSCAGFGYFGGALTCSADCKMSKAGCYGSPGIPYGGVPQDPDYVPACGNKTVDSNEECEATFNGDVLWPKTTCKDQGFLTGNLKCTNCQFDTSFCSTSPCGDGIANSGEACDGYDLGGKTCVTEGFYGGKLSCTAMCTFDTGKCYTQENDPYK